MPEPIHTPVQRNLEGDAYNQYAVITRDMFAAGLAAALSDITLEQFVVLMINSIDATIDYLNLHDGTSNVGQKISLLFNPHRLAVTSISDPVGIYESLKDPKFIDGLARAMEFKNGKVKELLYQALQLGVNAVYYVGEFPPHTARDIAKAYELSRHWRVLDPCGGWGGRMIGFSTAVDSYTCCEPSTRTAAGLRRLAAWLQRFHPEFVATVHEAPFEDVDLEPASFDFALTSPPYYDTERYAPGESTNSFNRYASFDAWCAGFYEPLIHRTMAALKPGCAFVINIGSRKYPLSERLREIVGDRYAIGKEDGRLSGVAGLGKEGEGETFYILINPGECARPLKLERPLAPVKAKSTVAPPSIMLFIERHSDAVGEPSASQLEIDPQDAKASHDLEDTQSIQASHPGEDTQNGAASQSAIDTQDGASSLCGQDTQTSLTSQSIEVPQDEIASQVREETHPSQASQCQQDNQDARVSQDVLDTQATEASQLAEDTHAPETSQRSEDTQHLIASQLSKENQTGIASQTAEDHQNAETSQTVEDTQTAQASQRPADAQDPLAIHKSEVTLTTPASQYPLDTQRKQASQAAQDVHAAEASQPRQDTQKTQASQETKNNHPAQASQTTQDIHASSASQSLQDNQAGIATETSQYVKENQTVLASQIRQETPIPQASQYTEESLHQQASQKEQDNQHIEASQYRLDIQDLVAYLIDHGHHIMTRDGKLLISDASTLRADVRAAIVLHRDALVEIAIPVGHAIEDPQLAEESHDEQDNQLMLASQSTQEPQILKASQQVQDPQLVEASQIRQDTQIGQASQQAQDNQKNQASQPKQDDQKSEASQDLEHTQLEQSSQAPEEHQTPQASQEAQDTQKFKASHDQQDTQPTQAMFGHVEISAPSLLSFLGENRHDAPTWTAQEPPQLDGIKNIILNFETNGLEWHKQHRPIGVTVGTLDGQMKRFLPFGFRGGGNLDENVIHRWYDREVRGKHITNANTKFECHMSRVWGHDLEEMGNTVSDVQHYAALLDDTRRKFNLDILAKDYLGGIEVERVDERQMASYEPFEVAARAEYQVTLVAQLRDAMWPLLDKEDLQRVRQLEDDVIFPVVEMEKNGAPLDVPLLKQWCADTEKLQRDALKEVSDAVGFRMNPDAPTDWERLFSKFHIPIGGYTESKCKSCGHKWEGQEKSCPSCHSDSVTTGKPSFTDKILKTIDNPYVQLSRKAGKLASLRSKFLVAYDDVVGADGILRFSLHQCRTDEHGTVRGRFSASDKNIQQVMNHDTHIESFGDEDFFIRRLFIPGNGLFYESDAEQIEFRIFASYSKSKKLAKAYADDPSVSFHRVVWEMVKPFKPDIQYTKVKSLNFLKVYGGGKGKASAFLELPRAESDQFCDMYDQAFPEVRATLREAEMLARGRGYVKSIEGRRARFADPKFAYKALNAVIQPSAADIFKRKVVEVHAERKQTGFVMRMPVHDSLCGDVPDVESGRMVRAILNRQSFPQIKIPILWSGKTGPNWGECK